MTKFPLLAISLFLLSCSSKETKLSKIIEQEYELIAKQTLIYYDSTTNNYFTLCDSFKNTFPSSTLIEKITQQKESIFSRVDSLNQVSLLSIKNTDSILHIDFQSFNIELAGVLLDKIQSFSNKNTFHPRTPFLLLKGADLSRGLGDYGTSIQMLTVIVHKWPNFERKALALFILANLEKEESQFELATKHFNQIIIEFPNSSLANDSKKLLDYGIEISDEELLQKLLKSGEQ